MRVCSPPVRALLFMLCAVNFSNGQRSIRNSLLDERKDWIQPGGRLRSFDNDDALPEKIEDGAVESKQDEESTIEGQALLDGFSVSTPREGDNDEAPAVCQRSLSQCQEQLFRHQLVADATNNGELTAEMVYLRKWVKAIMTRLEGGFFNQKDTPASLELSFDSKDLAELRSLLEKMDHRAASRLSDKLDDLVASAKVSFDYQEKPSKLQSLWLSVCDLLSEFNLLLLIRFAIVVLACVFVVVLVKSRSRVFTLSYVLFFIFWVSYFWYWQNLLRRSEADRYFMSSTNPCEETRSWFNPARYFHSNSEACQEYLRLQYTPTHMEYSPIEVLLKMVFEYSSKSISMGVRNLLSGLGLAVREFADQQSWFSVVPAFFLISAVALALTFKASGMALSVFGFRMEASGGEAPRVQRIASSSRRYTRDRTDHHLASEPDSYSEQRRPNTIHFVDPLPASTVDDGSSQMPPPANAAVPRRAVTQIRQPQCERPRNRKKESLMAAGDCAYGRDSDDEYDTANDDNDL